MMKDLLSTLKPTNFLCQPCSTCDKHDTLYEAVSLQFQTGWQPPDTVHQTDTIRPPDPIRRTVLVPEGPKKKCVHFSKQLFMVHEYQPTKQVTPQATKPHLDSKHEMTNKEHLLAWHLQLGHQPFGVLIHTARLGILPSNIICNKHPKCPSCLYGKGTRCPW